MGSPPKAKQEEPEGHRNQGSQAKRAKPEIRRLHQRPEGMWGGVCPALSPRASAVRPEDSLAGASRHQLEAADLGARSHPPASTLLPVTQAPPGPPGPAPPACGGWGHRGGGAQPGSQDILPTRLWDDQVRKQRLPRTVTWGTPAIQCYPPNSSVPTKHRDQSYVL